MGKEVNGVSRSRFEVSQPDSHWHMFRAAFKDIIAQACITTVAVCNKNCAYSVDAALPQSVFGIRSNAAVLFLQHKPKALCVIWVKEAARDFSLNLSWCLLIN